MQQFILLKLHFKLRNQLKLFHHHYLLNLIKIFLLSHYKGTFKLLKLLFILDLKVGLSLSFLHYIKLLQKFHHFYLSQKLKLNLLENIFFCRNLH